MMELIILLFVWSIDLPLLENNPFIFSRLKRYFLLSDVYFVATYFDLVEKSQNQDEILYLHLVGLYESNLFMKLYKVFINKLDSIFFLNKLFFSFLIFLSLIYSWRSGLIFFISAILLPIIMYYICVLADYHEAIREIIVLIQQILENNPTNTGE
jgi:hypothetical protein